MCLKALMIQVQTWLKTRDNSGARSVECIQTLGGGQRSISYPSDLILVSIKRLRLLRKVKIGEIHLALITRARKIQCFRDGTSSFSENNIVLLRNRKKRVLGTRFFGWVSRRLRRKKFLRILLLCGRQVLLLLNIVMIRQYQKTSNQYPLSPITEHANYNINLYQASIFPYEHTHRLSSMESRVLSFRFRSIGFNKKRSLLFFLSLELLTGKKAIASLSSRNIQSWKIRKGRLVGCKVTLRRESLHEFLDTFLISLPRREKLYPFAFTGKHVKKHAKKYNNQMSVSFRFGELVLFYPIEIGIGLHSDLQYLQRTCKFNSNTIEDRLYYFQAFHFPII